MFEIEITKVFSAAHAIRLYDGSLEPLHGHDFQAKAYVQCEKLDEIEVVMDFHQLEAALTQLLAPWQNQNLNECHPFQGEGRHNLSINPTAEMIAWWLAKELSSKVDDISDGRARLIKVSVTEAPGCLASFTL